MLRFIRDLWASGRLAVATIIGLIAFIAAPAALRIPLRGVIGWDVGAAAFLGLTILAVGRATPARLRQRAGQQDAQFWVTLAIICVAALASLASLAFVLQKQTEPGGPAPAMRIVVAALTLVISWTFVHTAFAIRYAHFFYGDPEPKGHRRGGLAFPGVEHPDFWDFIYYAFVVGMTCQVSDVQVTTRQMRRLTLAHGVLSFFFNAGVLAVAVNILAAAL